ncbi:MAG: hypothetical protein M0Z94_05200, partial [Dehalococcoidales bacterium]|nr:hypothetical protein [Dehalococcoidales bacterium]
MSLLGPRLRTTLPTVLALLALPAIAITPLLAPGLATSHDGPQHIFRAVELDLLLRQGVLYPRWAPDFNQGLGYPLFNFYAPLTYYLLVGLHWLGLGFGAALKALFALGFLAFGVGMYVYARDLVGRAGALVTAAAYVYVPYHFTEAYIRADAAEFLALAFLPPLLWAFRRLLAKPSLSRLVVAGVLYAGLILTHNLTAFFFSGLLALYILVLALWQQIRAGNLGCPRPFWKRDRVRGRLDAGQGGRPQGPALRVRGEAPLPLGTSTDAAPPAQPFRGKAPLPPVGQGLVPCRPSGPAGEETNPHPYPLPRREREAFGKREREVSRLTTLWRAWRPLLFAGGAAALGLALGACYWLPALGEKGLVQIDRAVDTPFFSLYNHFAPLGELLAIQQPNDLRLANPELVPRQLGLTLVVLAAIALVGMWVRPARPGLRLHACFFACATVGLVFAMTEGSAPLWQALPLAWFIQFPWRLLGFTGLSLAVLAGVAGQMLVGAVAGWRQRRFAGPAVAAVLL